MNKFLMAFAALLLAGDVALAQAVPATGTIDYGQAFGWLQPYVISFVGSLITALSAYVLWQIKTKLGINIDQDQADVYLRAAKNQAASLIAGGFVQIKEHGKVEISNTALAAAANDLLQAVPDATGHFGVQLEDAMKKIVAMVPQVPAAAVPTVNGVPIVGHFIDPAKQ